VPQRLVQDALAEGIDHVMIWLDLPGDQCLTQAERRVDCHLGAFAGEGVGGKEHARGFAGHHLLHDHRQRYVLLIDPVSCPVADCARGPQAAPAADHRSLQCLDANYVEECVLLSGKGESGQVLGRRRRADSDRLPAEDRVGGIERASQAGRQRKEREPVTNGPRRCFECAGIVG
jgi:hypothetical protein